MLEHDPAAAEDPLVAAIPARTVQRQPMRPVAVDAGRAACAGGCRAALLGGLVRDMARAVEDGGAQCAQCAHPTDHSGSFRRAQGGHCLERTTSEDRLPDASLGADPVLLFVMRWAMASWERASFMNRYLGGTVMPRLTMDFLPGLLCSAHFALVGPNEPDGVSDRVAAGRAVQRFWLTATRLNLQVQPSYTPLVFARYARGQRTFTSVARAEATAREIAARLEQLLGAREPSHRVPGPHRARAGGQRAIRSAPNGSTDRRQRTAEELAHVDRCSDPSQFRRLHPMR